jgi:hypothetical protein
MCRSIKPLFNFDPPSTPEEIQKASSQFVKKISGFPKPSKVNEKAFQKAVEDISRASQELLNSLTTTSNPKNREVEIIKSNERGQKRFS